MNEAVEQFRDAIRSAGLEPPEVIESDGALHRFASNGKRRDDAGWYVLHPDGIPAGSFGDWRTGHSETWRADIGRGLTPQEEAAYRSRVEAMRREREAEDAKVKAEARKRAAAIWQAATAAPENHPYLVKKRTKPHGLRVHDGALVVPIRDGANTQSLQFIGADGEKRFLTGGRVRGCYYQIGTPNGVICIVEGFATGASVHEATGHAVAIAFNAGNLLSVAQEMRSRFPDAKLVICADDDSKTPGNPGITKATEAARAVGGLLAVPDFGPDRPEGATDMNDLARIHGTEAVRRVVEDAVATVATVAVASPAEPLGAHGWPEPQPLAAKIEPQPYPIDALPDTIRAAVEEVGGFVKAPLPLVASSALAALSLAAQAHIDIKRADRLQGPTGLYLLTIADSGERKSTCDGFFVSAIRHYQDEQAEAMKPAIKRHEAEFAAWTAERDGLLSEIKTAGKKGKVTDQMRGALVEIQKHKPEPPRVPRLLYADATPEALAYALAKQWPSGGVVSAEAGIVFGSHGMGRDSVMRNLALLNQLWDGTSLTIDRRTSESFTVRGARLTIALQIQEPTLRGFFDRDGGLSRGTGFLARFLVAWPASTQGFRPFNDPPDNWPALAEFNRRIATILDQPVPIDEDGALMPTLMMLTPEAKAAWVTFHDAIESELASGGELYDVRDVASKIADNAVRLAALFQVFEHGMGAVGLECFDAASRIAAWHLNESRRFFGELALPRGLADAARLDAWMIEHCRRKGTHMVSTRDVQQFGPGGLREKAAIEAAVRELDELSRARLAQDGKRRIIQVNPALLIIGGRS